MIDLKQINPVTDFVRNYKSYLQRLKQTKTPEVLTVNGKAECVLVDPESYHEMVAALEEKRFVNAVNQGIESMNQGKGKPVQEAVEDIRGRLGI